MPQAYHVATQKADVVRNINVCTVTMTFHCITSVRSQATYNFLFF